MRRPLNQLLFSLPAALLIGAGLGPADADVKAPEPSPPGPQATSVAQTARDAGIRYGQAGGAAAVCENTHTTAKAEQLIKGLTSGDLDAFKVQAETVLSAWKKTLTCEKTGDPNQCRLIHQISCKDAYREIGPEGAALPGLIEYRKP